MTKKNTDVTTLPGFLNWHRKYARVTTEFAADPIKAACWYVAYQEARGLLECLTAKDLARMLCEGEKLPQYRTRKHLREWLEERVKEYGEEPEARASARLGIKISLNDFWIDGGEG